MVAAALTSLATLISLWLIRMWRWPRSSTRLSRAVAITTRLRSDEPSIWFRQKAMTPDRPRHGDGPSRPRLGPLGVTSRLRARSRTSAASSRSKPLAATSASMSAAESTPMPAASANTEDRLKQGVIASAFNRVPHVGFFAQDNRQVPRPVGSPSHGRPRRPALGGPPTHQPGDPAKGENGVGAADDAVPGPKVGHVPVAPQQINSRQVVHPTRQIEARRAKKPDVASASRGGSDQGLVHCLFDGPPLRPDDLVLVPRLDPICDTVTVKVDHDQANPIGTSRAARDTDEEDLIGLAVLLPTPDHP